MKALQSQITMLFNYSLIEGLVLRCERSGEVTTNKVVHILDYPPRGTGCGLYYPKRLLEKGFGTYHPEEVTCKRCIRYLKKRGVAK